MIMSSLRARSISVSQLSIALLGFVIAAWSSPALAQTLVSIAVFPPSVTVGTGSNQQFTATGTYSDGTAVDLTNSVSWAAGGAAVNISSSGLASVVASSSVGIPITATSGGVSGLAFLSAIGGAPVSCSIPTTDLKLLVVNNSGANAGAGYADFPAILQALNYFGVPYTVVDVSAGVSASMLSDGSCHGFYQGVIFAFGNDIYTLPGMPLLTAYEQTFKARQINWFTFPGTDFGLNPDNATVDSTETYSANFTPAGASTFFYANTSTPLSISNAFVYLATPNNGSVTPLPAGASVTPLLSDSAGNALSLDYVLGDGREYLTQTFDSNPYLTHDLVLAYGLVNWVTRGIFLGEYHVFATQSIDDFFINDAEWIPGTACTNPITHDRTLGDDPSLPTFRLTSSDMTQLVAWQKAKQSDPLLSNFELSIAFNGVGTAGNTDWTGVPAGSTDTLVADLESYQQYFHWMSHTYDHPGTLDGLCRSAPTGTGCGDPDTPPMDSIDLEVLTNLWVASQPGGVNLDLDPSDAALAQLTFTDFDPHSMVTPGVTGLDDANVSPYLNQDGIAYVVTDTSVATTATNNNGPNPSPNVGIVNNYAPDIYEVPRHPNDVFFNAANWADDQAEFSCIYGPSGTNQEPFNTFTPAQLLDFVSTSFVNNMLLGDMDPEMFHQPNLHFSDNGASLGMTESHVSAPLTDVYDQTFSKYEALYNMPVLTPTQAQMGQAMQARNTYNLSNVTASVVGGPSPTINITVPAGASVPSAVISVTGLNSNGAEVYDGQFISHLTVNAGQTISLSTQIVTSTITWPAPAAITFGTALSATQLNAISSVPGTFVYTPAAGTMLASGTQTLSVTFTPTDPAHFTSAQAKVTLGVFQATPTVAWATPAAIAFGTALSATQLNATSSVPGTFVYTPAAGTVLTPGTQSLSAIFTPSDTADFISVQTTVALTVNQATPTVAWATPAAITFGTALGATQLNATSNVPGTFVYTPAAGTVLTPGSQSLSVAFTPTSTADFTSTQANVSLTVNRATPTVAWATPAAITSGTALSAVQLNATASVPGTFAYSPAAGSILSVGAQTLSVTFTPTLTTDYNSVLSQVTIQVNTAASLTAVSVSPTSVPGGTSSTGTVMLSGAAPTGGAVVTLASGTTAAATVPATVTVSAGQSSTTFTVTTKAVALSTPVTLSATYNSVKASTILTVSPVSTVHLNTMWLSNSILVGGASTTGTIQLTAAAPAGGASVSLASSNTAVTVPASVLVAAGATTATFAVTTKAVTASATAAISASYNGTTASSSLTITAILLNTMWLNNGSLVGGSSTIGTVQLTSAAPAGGGVVTLSSSNTAAATVPSTVTVASGATTATFAINTNSVTSSITVTISASYNSSKVSSSLTVTPLVLNTMWLNTLILKGGASTGGTVQLASPAPAGGVVVTLSSTSSSATVPASVTIAAGATTATFTVSTKAVKSLTLPIITATYNGVPRIAILLLTP